MSMIESIRKAGLKPQEVLAVREGIKPMLRTGTNKPGAEEINDFCRENGFHCIITPFNPLHGTKPKEQSYAALISKSKETVKEYLEIEKIGDLGKEPNMIKAGQLLGYPRCCMDFYIHAHEGSEKHTMLPLQILRRSKGRPSFYLNNIFNFDSREGRLARNKPTEVNPFYFLISHVPCSYNCEKSIEYGKKVLEILRKEDPKLANEILHHIRRPVLFFNDLNWVVFNGEVGGNEIRYKEIIYHCLDSKDLLEKLRSGNRIRVDKNNPDKGVIFDFG